MRKKGDKGAPTAANFARAKQTARKNMKKGGFPDLSGDGKVTKKDILIGRGVIKKSKGGTAMPAHKEKKKMTRKRVLKRGGGMMKPKMMGGGNVMKKRMKRGGKVK